jgi:hypothetical protein
VFKETNSVEIILDPNSQGWILDKISTKLQTEFSDLGVKCSVLSKPKYDSSVVFWIHYSDKTINFSETRDFKGISSALVTHVDDSLKLARIRKLYLQGIDLIFMSKEHAHNIASSVGMNLPAFNVLIGSDLAVPRSIFKVGIVSRCYPDGRKNENWLLEFAAKGLLENVELTIIGSGWGNVIKNLRSLGVSVLVFDGHENPYPTYSEILRVQANFDLFLNFGFDEGSLGALDAFLLKTDLLVSYHGFHIEFDLKEDSYVLDLDDACAKFESKKSNFFSVQESLRQWSWSTMAIDLLRHWDTLGEKEQVLSSPKAGVRQVYVQNYLQMLLKTLKRIFLVRLPRKVSQVIRLLIRRFQ